MPNYDENAKKIQAEIDAAVQDLEKKGINVNSHFNDDTRGLGDVVEDTLKKFGITEERFKQWFGLNECHCTKRKKWLNGLFSWKVHKK
jgi:hypothetical protein